MKISFITTLYNEEKTISSFITSIFGQTKLPDEIVIVDGGSKDETVTKINDLRCKHRDFKGNFVILEKKGNRSIGRNEAIRKATGDIIVCSDAGNILDEDWVKNITKPFVISHSSSLASDSRRGIEVVAGYYQGMAKTVFQKCLIPSVLVMPDKIDPSNFLPATRSVAFTKKIWEKVGGFDEKLSHNEDYAFAKQLQKKGATIVFQKDALVYWQPRTTFRQAFTMFFRFAYGDAEANIFRPKVAFLFVRYAVGIFLFILAIMIKSVVVFISLLILFLLYLGWAIAKNYSYVRMWQAFYLLPAIQLTADWAVLEGTISGLLRKKITY